MTTTSNPTTKTLEELKAEAEAAQAALQEKQQQLEAEQRRIKELEREEKRKAEIAERRVQQRKLIDGLRVHMVKLQEELAKQDITVELKEGAVGDYTPNLPTLNFKTYKYKPEFTERRTADRWHSKHLGYNITVGDYGDKKTFPPKKDGSYNYEKIADEIASRIKQAQREYDANANRRAKIVEAEMIAKVLGASVVTHTTDYRGRYKECWPYITLSIEKARALAEQLGSLEPVVTSDDAEYEQILNEMEEASDNN